MKRSLNEVLKEEMVVEEVGGGGWCGICSVYGAEEMGCTEKRVGKDG